MGGNQSSAGGQAQENGAITTSYYELLGVDRRAEDDEYVHYIKTVSVDKTYKFKDQESLSSKSPRTPSRPQLWQRRGSDPPVCRDSNSL